MSVFFSGGRPRARAIAIGSATVLASGIITALHAQSLRQTPPSDHAGTVSTAAIAPLIETQNAFAAVASQVTPAVVTIHIEGTRPVYQRTQMPDIPDLRQFGFPDIGIPFGGRGQRGGQPADQVVHASGSGFIV